MTVNNWRSLRMTVDYRLSLGRTVIERVRRLSVAAVAGFAAVALGHPDGLRGQAIGLLNQVALGSVDGLEALRNGWPGDLPAVIHQPLAQGLGQRRDLVNLRNALAIDRLRQLAATKGRLARLDHQRRQSLGVEAEELLASRRSAVACRDELAESLFHT